MSRRASPALAPLETLHEAKRGAVLPLPPRLARLYGRLRMPTARTRPHVFSNFAATLDGGVSLNVKGHESETRSEEHTSELQSLTNLVCRLLLEKKKT